MIDPATLDLEVEWPDVSLSGADEAEGGGVSWEVVTIGVDENLQEIEEVYTICETEADAMRAFALLRQSMVPLVIVVREKEEA